MGSSFDRYIFKYLEKDLNQGGKGEVVGQLSCIYKAMRTKILKIKKKNLHPPDTPVKRYSNAYPEHHYNE